MTRTGAFALLLVVSLLVLAGCGGGKSSSSDSSLSRMRAIASARLRRSIFAVATIALNTAPDPAGTRSRQLTRISPLRLTRAAVNGVSDEAGVFYVTSHFPDQSGRIDLFLDAAHVQNAGGFTWPSPK